MGEIKRFIRDDGLIKVSRSLKELAVKISELQKLYIKNGKEIKIEEISKVLKVPKEEIVQALDALNPVDSIYDKTYSGDDEGPCLIDKISGSVNEAGEIVNKICARELIEELNERERELILLRYYKGQTQTEVAKVLGITQVQVSRIEKRVLNSMRMKLAM